MQNNELLLVDVVSSEIFLSEVVWSDWMELRGEDLHVRELLHDPVPGLGGAEEVDEDDVLLRHVVLLQHLDCFTHFVARSTGERNR